MNTTDFIGVTGRSCVLVVLGLGLAACVDQSNPQPNPTTLPAELKVPDEFDSRILSGRPDWGWYAMWHKPTGACYLFHNRNFVTYGAYTGFTESLAPAPKELCFPELRKPEVVLSTPEKP